MMDFYCISFGYALLISIIIAIVLQMLSVPVAVTNTIGSAICLYWLVGTAFWLSGSKCVWFK